MDPVAAEEGEKGGEEGAARRARALIDQADEFVDLKPKEAKSEHASRGHAAVVHQIAMRSRADGGQAAGEARKQEASGLDRDVVQVEQILAARPSCGLSG